jgi:membrane protein DedA with SNARE-associated domain
VLLPLLSLTNAFDSLANLVSDSPWTYVLILGLAALDVLFPVVPSETAVILAGVLAGTGHLSIELVLISAAVGAFIGDNSGYWVGRTAGRSRVAQRLLTGDRKAQVDKAQAQVEERGGYFIIIGRFVPGGRTVVVLACGLLKLRWARFMAFDAIAAVIWAAQASLAGYFGGRAFEDNPWLGLLVGATLAFLLVGSAEGWRRVRAWRAKRVQS